MQLDLTPLLIGVRRIRAPDFDHGSASGGRGETGTPEMRAEVVEQGQGVESKEHGPRPRYFQRQLMLSTPPTGGFCPSATQPDRVQVLGDDLVGTGRQVVNVVVLRVEVAAGQLVEAA